MAIEVTYRKRIPYPFARVLSQYFDLEHIETVHPTTLGSYRAVEVAGNRIVFEQRWPSWLGLRLRSVVEQVWLPPNRIRIRFRRGFLRGVGVDTELADQGDATAIEEAYRVPLVPGWSWLRPWMGRVVERGAGRIWEEDLAVELCHGGWPGVPGREGPVSASAPSGPATPPRPGTRQPCTSRAANGLGRWIRVAERSEVADGRPARVAVDGTEIVLLRHAGRLYALDNRCTHTDGPLALGWIEGDRVVCPWHGARFGLADGLPCSGPADRPVATYAVREEGGGVFVQLDGAAAAL
ncbi:MAG: non-heme iron oxygenase ferredoxin subunit [Acidobacteria bacterium]|nr:non-heme iron oxygenase ferredoxin subunit [Acidobacteriota bacterium]